MTALLIGWSFAGDTDPGIDYGRFQTGVALQASEWGADRGERALAQASVPVIRARDKGNPSAARLASWASSLGLMGWWAQVLNEPNLNEHPNPAADVEHFKGGPEEHASWIVVVKGAADPHAKILFTPMSPGVSNWERWLVDAAIAVCDGICAHIYGPADRMWADLQPVLAMARKHGKPVVIGECGPANDQDPNIWGRDHLPVFADRVAREAPEVVSLCVFAPHWDRPDGLATHPVRFVGTDVDRWMRAYVPPAANPAPIVEVPAMPAANPWRGKILTVWNLPADPGVLKIVCQQFGCDGVEIKVADGASAWGANRHVTREYADTLRAAGLRVLTWSYNYCDSKRSAGDRGDGIPSEEAAAARAGATLLDSEGHTFDLEIECEGHHAAVAELLTSTYRVVGLPIAAHVWGYLEGHESYPYKEIVERVDWLRPMIYRPVWAAGESWASWERHVPGSTSRFVPVWGITEGDRDDIEQDMSFADSRAIQGEAYWEMAGYPGREGVLDLIRGRHFGQEISTPPALFDYEASVWAPIYAAQNALRTTGKTDDDDLAEVVHRAMRMHKSLKGAA